MPLKISIFFFNTSLMHYWSRLNAHNVFECNIKGLNGQSHTTRYKSNWSSISCSVQCTVCMVHQFYEAITLIHIFIMTYRLDGCEWRCQMLVLSISHSHQFCPYLLSTYQYLSIIPLFPVHISRIIWELCRWPWSARGSWVEPDALEPVHKLVSITNKILELVSSFNQLS